MFVADEVGVQLQVSSGDDGGSLGVGGSDDPEPVGVGSSLGVGSAVSDGVDVGDGWLVEGAGSEPEGVRVGWGFDGCLVVDDGGTGVEGGVADGGPPGGFEGRDGFAGGCSSDVPAGFDGSSSGFEFGGQAGELSDVVRDVGHDSGRGFGVARTCPVGPDACES